MRTGTTRAALLAATLASGLAGATEIVVMVGDDDGFGGTQPVIPTPPGSGFVVVSEPSIPPGSYAGEAATDVATALPWTPYDFTFEFEVDLTNLACVSTAVFELQTGSLGRRSNGEGFGFATVEASVGKNALDLGELLLESTGDTGSPAEESVRLLSFDLVPLVTPLLGERSGGPVTIAVTLDGTELPDPVDLFWMDYARVRIVGSPLNPLCSADLDCDGVVGGADLAIVLSAWGGAGEGDLDGSGSINGVDLGILLSAWGECEH